MKERKAIPERFKNKVAIITGGSSGIGKATVEEICKEGASVVFTGLEDDGHQMASMMTDHGFSVAYCQGDMSGEQFCKDVVAMALTKFGKVNYLLNNAFSFVSKGPDATRADWLRTLEVGPIAFALMASLVAPSMQKQGGGAIVNVSSISAFIAQPNRWTYNAAKGAVHTLTKCMALDLASSGIRVNSVSPGWIWTREVLKAAAGDREKWGPVWGQYHILERLGEPTEVAAAILFLFSDDASFVNAADLAVDGGYGSLGPEGLGNTSKFAGSS
jgi:NAD(P)-dependent dehydrogenase (short-subunit alcohol dehydrogenase family)